MSATSGKHGYMRSDTTFGHAVVIGGSIAGLTAARVLADHFARVTIIERDPMSGTAEFRPGVPQARHAHILLPRGQAILEQHFPGLGDELVASGATSIDRGEDIALYVPGGWHQVRHYSAIVSMTFSRPLLENAIYRRVAGHPRVHVIQEHEAVGLYTDRQTKRVAGVRLRLRHTPDASETGLEADLVVDASGRGSRAPQWLADLGYALPRETTVNSFPAYATRIYRRPSDLTHRWKVMMIKSSLPKERRGGLVVPIEGDRWHVTLLGMGEDYPPIDEEGFLDFARSLPTPELYEAIKGAEPLTKPYGYRGAVNRLRHYDRLSRYVDGFLVTGDAVFAPNPKYAQGMTVAAMGSLALERSLQAQRRHAPAGDVTGLSRAFQRQLARVVAGPWKKATAEDRRWAGTQISEHMVSGQKQAPSPIFNPMAAEMTHSVAHQ
jgi:2-polyprenyl-6-methoxyphenol hydroxylase-like FAD-dependent oxidoreductase